MSFQHGLGSLSVLLQFVVPLAGLLDLPDSQAPAAGPK